MTKNLAIVLPMYNEKERLPKAFEQLRQVVDRIYPEFLSRLFVFVDGSTDGTPKVARSLITGLQLPANYHYTNKNTGLALTTSKAFSAAIYCGNDYVLKTDVDGDFDLGEVVLKLTQESRNGADAIIGVREFKGKSLQEIQAREYVLGILEKEFGKDAVRLDPAQVGSYLYKADALGRVMQDDAVTYFIGRWGFDFLLSLVSLSRGLDVRTINLPYVNGDEARRNVQKVNQQYATYLPIIAAAKYGFSPEVKSLLTT